MICSCLSASRSRARSFCLFLRNYIYSNRLSRYSSWRAAMTTDFVNLCLWHSVSYWSHRELPFSVFSGTTDIALLGGKMTVIGHREKFLGCLILCSWHPLPITSSCSSSACIGFSHRTCTTSSQNLHRCFSHRRSFCSSFCSIYTAWKTSCPERCPNKSFLVKELWQVPSWRRNSSSWRYFPQRWYPGTFFLCLPFFCQFDCSN